MNINKWLEKVAYKAKSTIADDDGEIYHSNFDNSYITRVAMAKDDGLLKFLAKHGVTDELTHGVGFSPEENKWYGWSHRAIFGFTIGSECKKGNCHYVGSSIDEQKEDAILFWTDDDHINVRSEGVIEKGEDKFFDIAWDYTDKSNGNIGGTHHFITPLGRGEWTAKTLDDAKLMAVDFNEGVS